MVRKTPFSCRQSQAMHSAVESRRRLRLGCSAMSPRMKVTSVSVTRRPRYLSFVSTGAEDSEGGKGTQGENLFFPLRYPAVLTWRHTGCAPALSGLPFQSNI